MSESEELRLEVLLELRDYLRANYWFLFRRLVAKLAVGIAIMAVFLSIYVWVQNPEQIPWGGFVLPGFLLLMCLNIYISAKRSFSSNRSLQEKIVYSFTKSGIAAESRSSNGHTSWENIFKAFETKSSFLLFISRNQMYTLPKKCFPDLETVKSFRSLLKANLSSRAKLFRG